MKTLAMQCGQALGLPADSTEVRNAVTLFQGLSSPSDGRGRDRRQHKQRLMADYRTQFFPPGLAGWLAWLAVRAIVSRIFDWLLEPSQN